MADLSAWRVLVDKELAGAPFDKLVQRTPEGIAIQPLYVERPDELAYARAGAATFRLVIRIADERNAAEELAGGADAVWLADRVVAADGTTLWSPSSGSRSALISGLGFHDAGADAADELALALSAGVAALRAGTGNAQIVLQLAVGRDTFGELCKLRAARHLWARVLEESKLPVELPPIHAVCSARTMAASDAAVNMLRVTTQIFAAILGGADWITPNPFDASALARRIARNTALVLRDESHLGRVIDAAGGSFYFETRTADLAREAWSRFAAIEREGGVRAMIEDGRVATRLEAAWAQRAQLLAKRREPILGVSEFANLDEPAPASIHGQGHRDAEAFEALRAHGTQRAVQFVALGPASEHRARLGFAEGLFALAGVRPSHRGDVAVLCGSDERYAAEGVQAARAAREAGATRIVLAGRGPVEGVDAYVYVGCDVVATLAEILS